MQESRERAQASAAGHEVCRPALLRREEREQLRDGAHVNVQARASIGRDVTAPLSCGRNVEEPSMQLGKN
eukprot:scaffold113774_cov32-Tisochrysis_lutea.AAC.6